MNDVSGNMRGKLRGLPIFVAIVGDATASKVGLDHID